MYTAYVLYLSVLWNYAKLYNFIALFSSDLEWNCQRFVQFNLEIGRFCPSWGNYSIHTHFIQFQAFFTQFHYIDCVQKMDHTDQSFTD